MSDQPKRKFWQIHLSTALALSVLAGILFYANTIKRDVEYWPAKTRTISGFPFNIANGHDPNIFLNAASFLFVSFGLWKGLEHKIQNEWAWWKCVGFMGIFSFLPIALYLGGRFSDVVAYSSPKLWIKGWPTPSLYLQHEQEGWTDFPNPFGALNSYTYAFLFTASAILFMTLATFLICRREARKP